MSFLGKTSREKEKYKVYWIGREELLDGTTHVEKIRRLGEKTYELLLFNKEVGKVKAVIKLTWEEEEGWKLLDLRWGEEVW